MNKDKVYCGVDVSKKYLDTFISGKTFRFENNNKGIAKMKKSALNAHFIFEASGGYERIAAWPLMNEGQNVSIVNPGRVREFAKSQGYLAKTDALDARVICEFAETKNPAVTVLPSKDQQRLTALVDRRKQLINNRTSETNRIDTAIDSYLIKSIKKHINYLNKEIHSIDEAIKKLISTSEEMSEKSKSIQEIKGLGPISAMSLLAYMPELGTLSRKQVAALVGVAPYNQDSGEKRGYRKISGGRKELRNILYMGAVSAIKSPGEMQRYFKRLVEENHRPKKVALIAVVRKLAIAANSAVKNPEFEACN